MGLQDKPPSRKGPPEHFSGEVWIDQIIQADEHSPLNSGHVHFAPGARTAWHSHEGGQTLYVTVGRGLVQNRGEDLVELRPGDVHRTDGGHEHWHGATPHDVMAHVFISEGPARWGELVSDEEYLRDQRG